MLVIIFGLYSNFHLDYSFIVQCWISSDLRSMNYLEQKLSSTLINLMFTAIFGWSMILSASQTHGDWWQLIPITNNTPWGKKSKNFSLWYCYIFTCTFTQKIIDAKKSPLTFRTNIQIFNKDVWKYYDNNVRCICFTHFKQVN